MEPALQVKLLRVLQERGVRNGVGDTQTVEGSMFASSRH